MSYKADQWHTAIVIFIWMVFSIVLFGQILAVGQGFLTVTFIFATMFAVATMIQIALLALRSTWGPYRREDF